MPNLVPDSSFPVVSVLVFTSVTLLLGSVYMLWRARRGTAAMRLQQRLDTLTQSTGADGQRSLLKQRKLSEMSGLARLLVSLDYAIVLERIIGQAGLRWSVSRLLLNSAVAAIAGLILSLSSPRPLMFDLLAAAVPASLPWLYLMSNRRRRLRKLEQQLPEALDLINRALRAGHSLPLGIQLLSEEMSDPIASEFRIVHEQVSFGVSLQHALTNLCERVPVTDFRYFAVSVLIQRQSGGNLTEVLGNLSRLIRDRLKLFARVRVLSSEGRLSAWTLGLLPFALGFILYLVNPTFIIPLWTDPLGLGILQMVLGMMALGILVLIRIVKIRV